jgi:hypothetical protein
VVGSPLHGVVDFSGCRLLQRMGGFLLHFQFRVKEHGAIFCAMVGFTTMEHALRKSYCVWASTVIAATIWCSASFAVLSGSLIEGPWVSFLRRCPKVLLPTFWWPTAIRIDNVH